VRLRELYRPRGTDADAGSDELGELDEDHDDAPPAGVDAEDLAEEDGRGDIRASSEPGGSDASASLYQPSEVDGRDATDPVDEELDYSQIQDASPRGGNKRKRGERRDIRDASQPDVLKVEPRSRTAGLSHALGRSLRRVSGSPSERVLYLIAGADKGKRKRAPCLLWCREHLR
jgi:hypothetical protein